MHGQALKVHIILAQHAAAGGGMRGGIELEGQKGRKEGLVTRIAKEARKAQISLMKGPRKEQ